MTGYKTEWLEEDRKRVMRMDQLYIEDGRHRPEHPKHGLYTGLHQEILIYEKWKKQKGE
tara:strand:- start:14311 stop:14487 length:177 start_codon:yes stop_codon:yes gene_type:complete